MTPTLHELRLAHPDLAEELSQSYPWIPASYQLPIEIRGYRILSVIGEGGQSVVLRAQDDVHSAVAIKVSTSLDHNELVLRERKLLGECDHPGIIQVISSGSHEGRAYFVMPHLRGATLVDRYSVRKPTTGEAVQIMAAICSALTHLHSRGIVHRDIKPANIWLDESGKVKLIDLGMAVQRTSWSRPLPAIVEFNGTPAFMSPEQASSDGSKDSELSDVFSAGATLYWMLTGVAPFSSADVAKSISLAANGDYDKGLLRSSQYPHALKQACLKAMASDPASRFSSAADFSDKLEAIRTGKLRFRLSKPVKAFAVIAVLLLCYASVTAFLPGGNDIVIADNLPEPPQASLEPEKTELESALESAPEKEVPRSNEQQIVAKEKKIESSGGSHSEPMLPAKPPLEDPNESLPAASSGVSGSGLAEEERPKGRGIRLGESKQLQQAKSWLARLGPKDEVAKFQHSKFELTGLNEIASELTHLHLVGEYYHNPPPSDQTNSPSQITTSNKKKQSTELTIDLRDPSTSRRLKLPPMWNQVLVKGRLADGSFTPIFTVDNTEVACGSPVFPVNSSDNMFPLETYVYIQHDEPSDPRLSITRFLQKPSGMSKPVLEKCQQSRLLLMSMLPVGAVSVEHYADKAFTQPVKTALPGTLYARYVDSQGKMVGFSAYRLGETFIREMADHAFEHVSSQEKKQKSIRRLIHYGPKERALK